MLQVQTRTTLARRSERLSRQFFNVHFCTRSRNALMTPKGNNVQDRIPRSTPRPVLSISDRRRFDESSPSQELSVRVSRYSELRPRLRVWRSTGPPPSDHSPTKLPDPRHQVTVCSSTKSVVIRLVNFSESCCVACPSGEANALFMLSLSSNHISTTP